MPAPMMVLVRLMIEDDVVAVRTLPPIRAKSPLLLGVADVVGFCGSRSNH